MSEIRVEVVYALPERQYVRQVKLVAGSSVEQAILASGLLELRSDIDLASNKVGIYSRPAKLSDELNDGDRVEIYRPLIADPKATAPSAGGKGKKIRRSMRLIFIRTLSSELQPATVMKLSHSSLTGRMTAPARLTQSVPVYSADPSTRLRCRTSTSAFAV